MSISGADAIAKNARQARTACGGSNDSSESRPTGKFVAPLIRGATGRSATGSTSRGGSCRTGPGGSQFADFTAAAFVDAAGRRNDLSTMSFGSVDTGWSRQSQRIISGKMAPPCFCPWLPMPQV